ncbi:MAG: hypothetical protein ACRDXX_06975 [Stackebrandtia sp.]
MNGSSEQASGEVAGSYAVEEGGPVGGGDDEHGEVGAVGELEDAD